ncbi:nicotinate-nucleotide adenylyltransferase [Aquimarina sp. MMG016]|uniref:nicotinate-nucleotide adenylyltransferase n=1 Tax=Aquimarina sp. MMG016 TaxID=2822690 RepID=UPI001B39F354|nr:nicotinate-nucleotide adenylyltransferase [Aquimarina sp. MMG016]MBQ4819686.1 nicotinate-nucleotide adenylyltransferase [Aquimarina sp. MMG016]
MKKTILALLIIIICTTYSFTQERTEQLSEVFISATNYKYLDKVDSKEVAVPVELLERKVATFNLQNADFYQDDYDLYYVSFYIPEGKILAAYDKQGNVIRTAERFKDIELPTQVIKAVEKRFPNWVITQDVYVVNYHEKKGAKKSYKLKLKNGEKVIRVKMNENGIFL